MNPQLHADVTLRLTRDFEFKERGRYLQQGRCPECGKREMFVQAESPWMLKCGRENKCGAQFHIKELFPELFESWSDRYGRPDSPAAKAEPASKTPVADAYLRYGRGFDLERIKGWYSQESYFDPKIDAGTATVRFPLANGHWERLIDKPERFGKQKARIRYGTDYAGLWWQPPGMDLTSASEIWITEGIFDTIALLHHDVASVAAISSNNFPGEALSVLAEACRDAGKKLPLLVWALDSDRAGRKYTLEHIKKAREAGWKCAAAQIPQRGKHQRDWNDCHQRGELTEHCLDEYRHHGALLIAASAIEKALLMYQRNERRREFPFEYKRRLFWFKLDMAKYEKEVEAFDCEDGGQLTPAQRNQALEKAGAVAEIANCSPTALYYQANPLTDEAWYYFRVEFPHDGAPIKSTFTSGQATTSSEFAKRLFHIAPGAIWAGSSQQLLTLLREQTFAIKTVDTIDYVGYSKEHRAYVYNDIAVHAGKIVPLNAEDYFDLGRQSVKTLSQSLHLEINANRDEYRADWATMLWRAYGGKGVVALAYWLGSLFAEQIRTDQASFPFLEVVGEAAAGKSTLLEFLWKLCGRNDYEGADPAKMTHAGRARYFSQVSNLPVVLIESDREQQDGAKQRQFDWDELKSLYNGGSLRVRGVKNSGNDTYEPPFRGSIVISQNAPVDASEAILTRIVQLLLTRETHTPETREIARELERISVDQVSGFLLAATTREQKLMELINRQAPIHEAALTVGYPQVRVQRIHKNHAQLMALVECLGPAGLNLLPQGALEESWGLLEGLAVERQQAINSDHPIVAEFWEAYDYIEGLKGRQVLNHYRPESDEIAINLRHFESEAAEHKLRIPTSSELRRHLKTSKSRKFIDSNRTVRSYLQESRTVKCWIFEKE